MSSSTSLVVSTLLGDDIANISPDTLERIERAINDAMNDTKDKKRKAQRMAAHNQTLVSNEKYHKRDLPYEPGDVLEHTFGAIAKQYKYVRPAFVVVRDSLQRWPNFRCAVENASCTPGLRFEYH